MATAPFYDKLEAWKGLTVKFLLVALKLSSREGLSLLPDIKELSDFFLHIHIGESRSNMSCTVDKEVDMDKQVHLLQLVAL